MHFFGTPEVKRLILQQDAILMTAYPFLFKVIKHLLKNHSIIKQQYPS